VSRIQQKVGVSVTALTGEALAERNVNDLQAMEGLSPGFHLRRSGVDARPAMRGVRTENVAVNGDTTIGFFVDGIYKSRAQQAMLGFVDVERLEVQRGPQGTLFGRNTFGGNIVITTNAPQLRTTEGSFNATLGNYGRKRADGAFNLPLGDKAAMRLAAVVERSDGWVRNDFNPDATLFDQDLKYLRGSFRLQPASNVDIVLRADVSDVGGRGGSAFGYKLIGSYLHQPSCQPLYNATFIGFNTRATLRDNVNDCTRTVGAGAGTGANAAAPGSTWAFLCTSRATSIASTTSTGPSSRPRTATCRPKPAGACPTSRSSRSPAMPTSRAHVRRTATSPRAPPPTTSSAPRPRH
jgi:iron complex outermembrane receptor protein